MDEKDIDIVSASDLFISYDKVVNATLTNIYTLSKENKKIILRNFNRKSKAHLFVLNVARAASGVFGFPLYIEGSAWNVFLINLKKHKKEDKILRETESIDNKVVDVPKLLKFEQVLCKEAGITYGEIYSNYYERKK